MRSKVKTGDVIQIRRNGPNYIALGKVKDAQGEEFLVITRNGNITCGGELKRSQAGRKPIMRVISGKEVKRVHGSRSVDMATVINGIDRRISRHLHRTTSTTGVTTEAPNIAAQLADLASAI